MTENIIHFRQLIKDHQKGKEIEQEIVESAVLFELRIQYEQLENICAHMEFFKPYLDSEDDFRQFHEDIVKLTLDTHNRIMKLENRIKCKKA